MPARSTQASLLYPARCHLRIKGVMSEYWREMMCMGVLETGDYQCALARSGRHQFYQRLSIWATSDSLCTYWAPTVCAHWPGSGNAQWKVIEGPRRECWVCWLLGCQPHTGWSHLGRGNINCPYQTDLWTSPFSCFMMDSRGSNSLGLGGSHESKPARLQWSLHRSHSRFLPWLFSVMGCDLKIVLPS